ncbi:hypothetical protein [Pollutibacter soli]|uniref:hypothetical protein n=1 Tax=Pollutibacter soli TaxID=3034157 RepID=UPI0030134361
MRSTITLTLILLTFTVSAQKIDGSWYGRADVLLEGSHNNYLAELTIKQKGSEVQGIMGYYFKNSYQSFFVRGRYNPKTRLIELKNVPIMYFRTSMAKATVDCRMDFEATLVSSQQRTYLKGYFLRDPQYKYTCPDLSINFTKDLDEKNPDSVLRDGIAAQRIWKPAEEEPVVTPEFIVEQKKIEPTPLQLAFEKRKPLVIKELQVESDSLRMTFYDNGTIDGDTISVFFNKVPVLTSRGLSVQGINLYVGLDPNVELNELSVFAESLGTIPPNTALVIIEDGINRFELFSTADFARNGTVYIRRKKVQN